LYPAKDAGTIHICLGTAIYGLTLCAVQMHLVLVEASTNGGIAVS